MRRSVLALVFLALSALLGAAQAQPRPGLSQLRCMTAKALADPKTVTFARPKILGFGDQPVITHQISQVLGDREYFFAVTNPRLSDGLVFFSHQPSVRTYRMHRTDTHLRRITSASNNLNRGAQGLVGWDGAAADEDFASQLDIGASFGCSEDNTS